MAREAVLAHLPKPGRLSRLAREERSRLACQLYRPYQSVRSRRFQLRPKAKDAFPRAEGRVEDCCVAESEEDEALRESKRIGVKICGIHVFSEKAGPLRVQPSSLGA